MIFARRPLALFLSAAIVGGLMTPEEASAAALPIEVRAGEASSSGAAARIGLGASWTMTIDLPAAPVPTLFQSESWSAAPTMTAAAITGVPLAHVVFTSLDVAMPTTGGAEEVLGESSRLLDDARVPPFSVHSADRAVGGGGFFDGASVSRTEDQAPVVLPPGRLARLNAKFGGFTARRIASYRAKRLVAHDEYGGPKLDGPKTFGGRVLYGLKWGLNLVGIAAIIDCTIPPLLAHFQWTTLLPPSMLGGFGRAELLIHFGQSKIRAALEHAPLPFLLIGVPWSTFKEEFAFRFFDFGLTFGLFAAAKPVAARIQKALETIPDAAGFRRIVQIALLEIGTRASRLAFPIAALTSSIVFAAAHFPEWGMNPAVFALNMISGWVLARAAYQTRGLTAPLIAHLFFNFATLGPQILAATLDLPLAATICGALTSIFGVAALWYNWRTARGKSALSRENVGRVKSLLIAALLSAALLGEKFRTMPNGDFALIAAPSASTAPAPDEIGPTVPLAAPATPASDAVQDFKTDADMIAAVKPSVVEIKLEKSIGSGVIVSPKGLIVTNGHVVGDKAVRETVQVEMSNGEIIPGLIVAVNHNLDLALVQLPILKGSAPWPFSTFAQTEPREGDPLLAMGHPLGLPFTVTKGILSGIGYRGNMFVQYLQTDASINHGNSGGPLFDTHGEIVGINTMIAGQSGSIGIGFAIAAASVVKAVQQYEASGNIATAALGVIVDLSSPELSDAGVAVESVRPGSAAEKAGLRSGDLIVGVGGKKISGMGEEAVHALASMLAQAKPGDPLELAVLRGDSDTPQIVTLKLDARATSEETSMAHDFDGEK